MASTGESYNRFSDIQVIDLTNAHWRETVNTCHPLLRDLAATALSAFYEGLLVTDNYQAFSIATREPLVNTEGEFNAALVHELGRGDTSAPDHVKLCYAGLSMLGAAYQVTQLFKDTDAERPKRALPVEAGVFEYGADLPVTDEEKGNAAGVILNTGPVTSMHAKIITHTFSPPQTLEVKELSIAAALQVTGEGEQSTSINVRSYKDTATRKVGGEVDGGEYIGKFIHPNHLISFTDITRFTGALAFLRDQQG